MVVVVQSAKDLKDTCIVIPLTTQPHNDAPTVHKLRRNYNPAVSTYPRLARIVEVWAVCGHLYTVSQSRLRPFQHRGQQTVPRMQQDDLDDVIACIRCALPQIFPAPPAAP
jgi:uncharacterized protein YifN (PemK superfamily)